MVVRGVVQEAVLIVRQSCVSVFAPPILQVAYVHISGWRPQPTSSP